MRDNLALKVVISVAALLLIAVRLFWPALEVDAVTLGLLAFAVLPWLSTLIKSAELPGGWKVEFQDVAKAGEKITENAPEGIPGSPHPSYLPSPTADPNLALVGLRIEIEKRLRALADAYDIRAQRALVRLIDELRIRGVLNDPSVSGLRELVDAGNRAAHGASVEPSAAAWAMEYGPRVLAVLDSKLRDVPPRPSLTPLAGDQGSDMRP